jgi:hypothetical protein
VKLLLEVRVVTQIQQFIAISVGIAKYLMELLAAMFEKCEAACRVIVEEGVLYSDKLKRFSFKSSNAMLRIYSVAIA